MIYTPAGKYTVDGQTVEAHQLCIVSDGVVLSYVTEFNSDTKEVTQILLDANGKAVVKNGEVTFSKSVFPNAHVSIKPAK
jgi:hypothetical protein